MPKFDLGHKMEEIGTAPAPESKKEIYYPSIHISSKDAEGLKLKMGENIKLDGVVVGVHKDMVGDEKKKADYDIDSKNLYQGYSKEEYLSKSEDEKDTIDEKNIEGKE